MYILIGDDHPLFREGIHRLLEQMFPDAQYLFATTFDEVLARCRGQDRLDLILTDLQMPGWPGFSGIRDVRSLRPETPLVVVSASESQSDVRSALEHGATGYIPKSSSVKVMLSALNLVLAGGIYVPPTAVQGGPMPAKPLTRPVISDRVGTEMLTQRQLDVLRCLQEGKSNKQIAYDLGLSEGTVKIHVTAIFKSLGVKNRTQAVISATKSAAAE
jgi:DNA-binding NarL/FixJ family response regulator